jgi:hypothetical protein
MTSKVIPRGHLVHTITETGAMVAQGLIVHPTMASMTWQWSRDDITVIPITDLPPIRIGLIWRTAHENARIRALAATARAIYPPPARSGRWPRPQPALRRPEA